MESSGKMEDYEVVQQIGRGALGATFLVLHKIENKRLGTVSFVCVCVFCVNLISGINEALGLNPKLGHASCYIFYPLINVSFI